MESLSSGLGDPREASIYGGNQPQNILLGRGNGISRSNLTHSNASSVGQPFPRLKQLRKQWHNYDPKGMRLRCHNKPNKRTTSKVIRICHTWNRLCSFLLRHSLLLFSQSLHRAFAFTHLPVMFRHHYPATNQQPGYQSNRC
jgi:hypothetical protein